MRNDDKKLAGLRILVVDDNSDAAAMTSMLLELEGHRTSTAHNGREAVREASGERYDAVLLDLHMPVMDGFQAAAALRQLRPAPVLIAHTSCGDATTRRRTAELGFSAHLRKPVPLAILQAVLGDVRRCSDGACEQRLAGIRGFPEGGPLSRTRPSTEPAVDLGRSDRDALSVKRSH